MTRDPASLRRARDLYPKPSRSHPYATTPPEDICSAYRGAGRCRNGFPTNPGCAGKHYLPTCLDEELCGETWPEDGRPTPGEERRG